MSELRQDPLTGHWVIVAPRRAERPNAFEASSPEVVAHCPFCQGHEFETPHDVAVYPPCGPDGEILNWRVRVVPNRYPAVLPCDSERTGIPISPALPIPGVHEVIIESPQHEINFGHLDEAQIALVFAAYRDRLLALSRTPGLAFGIAFKNSGPAAGASMEHVHSQIIALAAVPPGTARQLENAQAFFREHGRCCFCEQLAQELSAGRRVVAETPRLVALCPFASRFAYEIWLLPRQHASRFEHADASLLSEFAVLTKQVLAALERSLGRVDYNFLVMSAPFDDRHAESFHWHLAILPRLANLAGFELSTGSFINAVPPEQAAETLRRNFLT